MATSYGSVPFEEQIEFMRRKLAVPTRAYTDIYNTEHDHSFVVAGANRNEIVEDFHSEVIRFLEDGRTYEQFLQEFDRIVETYGWDYNGGRKWRSRVIYDTNLYSSYNAGRYQQMYAARDYLPYWQYHHSDAVETPREEHLAWDGMILHWSDPWWQWFFPINAWGCQCSVTALSEADLARMGKSGPDTAPAIEWEDRVIGQNSPDGPRVVRVPKGIDPGFEHIPGASRLHSAVPPELPDPSGQGAVPDPAPVAATSIITRPPDPLPTPRAASEELLLPQGLPDEEYAREFLAQFGATLEQPVIYRDVINEPLVIGNELFVARKTGKLKANKRNRGQYMRLLAEAIKDPDEIWVNLEYHVVQRRSVLRRRYIAQYVLPGEDVPALAVFQLGDDGWTGITVFDPRDNEIDDLRIGERLYRRTE
jgi:hypothetical protein